MEGLNVAKLVRSFCRSSSSETAGSVSSICLLYSFPSLLVQVYLWWCWWVVIHLTCRWYLRTCSFNTSKHLEGGSWKEDSIGTEAGSSEAGHPSIRFHKSTEKERGMSKGWLYIMHLATVSIWLQTLWPWVRMMKISGHPHEQR